MACLRMVLIIKWSAHPVDVNVQVRNIDSINDGTSKVEGDVTSLSNWVWKVSGGISVEDEDTEVIIALAVNDITSSLEISSTDHVLCEFGSHEVLWAEDI